MKNKICSGLGTSLLILGLTACAGRNAMPVLTHQVGDKNLNCEVLNAQKIENQDQIQAIKKERRDVETSNTAKGFTGLFLFWPGLLMLDNKTEDNITVETTALTQRNSNLDILLDRKNCPLLVTEKNNLKTTI